MNLDLPSRETETGQSVNFLLTCIVEPREWGGGFCYFKKGGQRRQTVRLPAVCPSARAGIANRETDIQLSSAVNRRNKDLSVPRFPERHRSGGQETEWNLVALWQLESEWFSHTGHHLESSTIL